MRCNRRPGIIVLMCIAAASACSSSGGDQKESVAPAATAQPESSPEAGYKWAATPRKGPTLTREQAKGVKGVMDTSPGGKERWMVTARDAEAIAIDDAELRKVIAGQDPNFEVLLRDSPAALKSFKPNFVANETFPYMQAFDNGEYFGYVAKLEGARDSMIAVYNDQGTQNGAPCLERVAAWYSSQGHRAEPKIVFDLVERLHFQKVGMAWVACVRG